MKTKFFIVCILSFLYAKAGTASVNDTAIVYGIIVFILVVLIGGGYVIKRVKQKLRGHEETSKETENPNLN